LAYAFPSFVYSATDDFEQLMNSPALDPFNSSSRQNCFTIMITNDTLFEDDVESFNVDLSLAIGVTRVRIDPETATVNILDDDGEFVCLLIL